VRVARLVLLAVGAASILGAVWWGWPQAVPVPRNVVVISLDTTRADALGAWGHPDAHTPSLDALAAESIRFARAYTTSPTTLASHTSLFTGNVAHTHGVPRNDHGVSPDNVLLAERLAEAGYDTAAFLGAMPLAAHSGFTQGFGTIDADFTHHRTEGAGQTERPGAEVTDAALAWLRRHDSDTPFFLFVHYFDAHAPYDPPADLRADLVPDLVDDKLGSVKQLQRLPMLRRRDPEAFPALAGRLERLYRAGVAEVDRQVGRLIEGLDALGARDDTLVIVVADHGETFASHDELFDHGETVYDESTHVPMLLRLPGSAQAGRVFHTPVALIDVVPTLIPWLGLPDVDEAFDGYSFFEALRRRGDWTRPAPIFLEATKPHLEGASGWQNDALDKAVVDGTWKYLVRPRRKAEALYDLGRDPEEQHDALHAEGARAAPLRAAMQAWRQAADPLPSPLISDARVQAELAALGYTDAVAPSDDDLPPTPE
jgi:arylsulfatase A-like enzyme